MVGLWTVPATVARNHFKHKSLSDWSFNPAVGCGHACDFCYVPEVSTRKLGPLLATYGVSDPDSEWGQYVLVRPFNESALRASIRTAEAIPRDKLSVDGNRAVMFSTTTDAYQVIRAESAEKSRELQAALAKNVSAALEIILRESTLRVRILTRSPLARQDFGLMKKFGNRLLFGMSLPTLDDQLARVYEPKAPSPTQRLRCLHAAKEAGLNVFVAVAPTYPECDDNDLWRTLQAIKELKPVTVFHEPINVRAENVKRIEAEAARVGVKLNTEVFATREAWLAYAWRQLRDAASIGSKLQLPMKLWPDASMGTAASMKSLADSLDGVSETDILQSLQASWLKVSAWPE